MGYKWDKMNDEQKIKYFAKFVTDNVKSEEEKHARAVVEEIHNAILDIDRIQQEFVDDKHPNRMNWLAKQLRVIAPKYKLDENKLYEIVLSELHKCDKSVRKSLEVSDIPDDEVDIQNFAPKTDAERRSTLKKIGGLLDAIAYGELSAVLKFLPDNSEEKKEDNDETISVQKALDTDFLSAEETDLKWQVAVHAYVELCKNEKFGGIPIAAAIQKAVLYVTNLKYLYKRQNGFTERLKRYLQSAHFATVVTLLRRAADLGLSFGVYYYEGEMSDYIKNMIEPLPVNEGLKEFIKFVAPFVAIKISHKLLDPLVKKACQKVWKHVREVLCSIPQDESPEENDEDNKKDEDDNQ